MKPLKLAAAAIVLSAVIAAGIWQFRANDEPKPRLGLVTSLPIYWPGSADFNAAIMAESEPHWVKTQLEENYTLRPLDTLANPDSAAPSAEFGALDFLLLAQPGPLPPADLAALDQWVREGGRLLLFADPVLTEHSEFGLGDRRRPQAIAMVDPVLHRWGLSLEIDRERRFAYWRGTALPLDAPGVLAAHASPFADCRVETGGLIAECDIGRGRAVVVADAAMLDTQPHDARATEAVSTLVAFAFSKS